MKINQYQDIAEVEKEAKKDYIDRHSPFIHCESNAVKNEKFLVKVKIGNEYQHPDDFDHYISYVQLWDREVMLAQATFNAGAFGSLPAQVETDFYIVSRNIG